MSDLATCFGRIGELQWRLRYRLQPGALADEVDAMTAPLAEELRREAEDLLKRVREQAEKPDV